MNQPPQHSSAGPLRQVVHSPDAVALEVPLAGPTSRMLAYAIDAALLYTGLLILLGLMVFGTPLLDAALRRVLEGLVDLTGAGQAPDPGIAWMGTFALLLLVVGFAEILYFVFWEMVNGGQSPGKRVLGLKVLRDGGLPISVGASLARNVLRLVDVLPSSYLVGLTAMVVSPEGKRLGDLGAGTIVVRLDRPRPEAPLAVDTDPRDAGFRIRRDQIARLGDAERALIRQTLRRLDELPPDRADAALERAVEALRTRIGFEEPVAAADRPTFLRALWAAASRR